MRKMVLPNSCLDENGFPTRVGVYLIKDPLSTGQCKVEVYRDCIGNLCVFKDDYGAQDAESDHVPVQNTGLHFIRRLGGFV